MKRLLACIALASLVFPAAAADHSQWRGYNWHNVNDEECLLSATSCQLLHAKWDWKRDQWVDLSLATVGGGLQLALTLTNNDRKDDDFVCVVVTFDGVAVGFFNEHSDPQTAANFESDLGLPPTSLSAVRKIEVGTKQCREGGEQDRDAFAGRPSSRK
jgi:opacity protein-like surface antigen